MGERVLLAAKNPTRIDDRTFRLTAVIPEGVASSRTRADLMVFHSGQELHAITVECNRLPVPSSPDGVYHFINVAVGHNSHADFVVDSHCLPLFVPNPTPGPISVLELCAGGFGGWKKSCTFLADHFDFPSRVMSVESSLSVAWNFAVSNGVPLLHGDCDVSVSDPLFAGGLVVHADNCETSWLRLAAAWSPEVVTISAPCGPWSSAGFTEGLGSSDGLVLAESIAVCKLLKPAAIILEQVPGFASHQHKADVLKLLRWAGYTLKFAKVIDAGSRCAATRSRWIAIAVKSSEPRFLNLDFQMWKPLADVNPVSFGALANQSLTADPRVWPSADVLRLASRQDLLPPFKRQHVPPDQVLGSRCHEPSTKVQTIVASYGSQHAFAESSLLNKGLLCHFVKEPNQQPRFWHPVELLLMHAFVGKHLVSDNWSDAYRHIGNQICIPHALLALANVFFAYHDRSPLPSIEVIFSKLHDKHVTFSSACITVTKVGLLVADGLFALLEGQQSHLETFWSQIVNEQLPVDSFWTLDGFQKIVNDTIVTEVSSSPEPTMSFLVFRPVSCAFLPDFHLQVDSSLSLDSLDLFWAGILEFFETPDGLIALPATFTAKCNESTDMIMVWYKSTLFVVRSTEVQWIAQISGDVPWDVLGSLKPSLMHDALLVNQVTDKFPPWEPTAMSYFAAFRQCVVKPFSKDDSSAFGFHCHGPPAAVRLVLDFWNPLAHSCLLRQLGFQLRVEFGLDTSHATFLLVASHVRLPLEPLLMHLFACGLRQLFGSLARVGDLLVRLHFHTRLLWEGLIPAGFNGEYLMDLVHSISFWAWPLLRVLAWGKQFDFRICFRDIIGDRPICKLYFIPPSWGGAPGGTKTSHAMQVRNALASAMLEEGYELQWVSDTINAVVTKIGIKELSKVLHANHSAKLQIAKDAVQQCGLDLPKIQPTKVSQASFQAKKAKQPVQLNPANYRVIEGALLNEDKTPTIHATSFAGQTTGYHCMLPSEALPWLTTTENLSKDELALLIFGDVPSACIRDVKKITLPCVDERAQQVLVSCSLVQFGDKQVALNVGDGFQISQGDTTLLAATLESIDWQDQWTEIVKAPFKFVRNLPFMKDIIISLWGRSYRRGRSPTTAEDATSLQVHLLVSTTCLPALLRAAGTSNVWLTPKQEDGKPHHAWKLIWLDVHTDLQGALVQSAKVTDSLGIIRLKGRFAVRVAKANYTTAWQQLFPGITHPEMVDTTRTYKLDSLPYGVTKEMLSKWAEHLQWKIKPLRTVGPKGWVIGAATPPPTMHLHFSSQPILVKEVTPRTLPSNPIVAGPRPVATKEIQYNPSLPPLAGDPWGNWKGTSASLTAVAPVASVGPTEQKFAQQESRITKLEATLEQMQQQQTTIGSDVSQLQQVVKQQDAIFEKKLDSRLISLRQDLDNSFSQALQKQSSQMDSNLQEIKQLLLSKPKRPRENEHPPMEDWLFLSMSPWILLTWTYVLMDFLRLLGFRLPHALDFAPFFSFKLLCLVALGFSWNYFSLVGCCRVVIPLGSSFSCLPFLSFVVRPLLGNGVRFGEAINPGPCNRVGLCITNPTCVSNKFDVYCDLLQQHSLHLISMSETAATQVVQRQLARKFHAKKCKLLWGLPVPPLTDTRCGVSHARGRASGVAMLSKLPCRPSRLQDVPDWTFSTRFLHGIFQVGQSHCQFIVLYCKPIHGSAEVEFNSKLMHFALQQIRMIPLPYVILGDFNMPATQFESWPEIAASGSVALTDMFLQQNAFDMPPSCKGATNPDNAIVSACLVPFVRNISVLDVTWFAAHSPVTFDLIFPGDTLFMHRLSLPTSFVSLDLDVDAWVAMDLSDSFQDISSLEDWGRAVEESVDIALRAGLGSQPALTKQYRGRCQIMKVTKKPVCSPCKQAPPGSYEPSTEVTTMACRRQVKQVRRLESLYRRLQKHAHVVFADLPPRIQNQLLEEWYAITRSHAFGFPFLHWLSRFEDMDFPDFPLPSASWTFEAYQLAKHFLERSLQDNLRIQRDKIFYARSMDRKANNRQAFSEVRGPGPPPVTQVLQTVTFDAMVVSRGGLDLHDVFSDVEDLSQISGAFPIFWALLFCWLSGSFHDSSV